MSRALGWTYRPERYAYEVWCERCDRSYAGIAAEVVADVARVEGVSRWTALRRIIDVSRGRFALLYTHECPRDVPSTVSGTQAVRRETTP
jgi:hypothetical protein